VTITRRAAARLDSSNPVPLYLQLESRLADRIRSGEWSAGDQIHTEDQLIEHYGVSRVTVRQALARLVDRGLLIRERGRGTFVRDASLTAGTRGVTSFTTELAELGMHAGARILNVDTPAAPGSTVEALQLGSDTQVIRIRRIRTGDGQAIGVQTGYYPARRFPELTSINLEDQSLYALLADRYAVAPTKAVETFTVQPCSVRDAELLSVRRGACCFHVERITYDSQGPFEHALSVMRGDRYRIRLALRNP
jgi:GntR family transcriptional regulator